MFRDDLEGWDGVGEAGDVQEGADICTPIGGPLHGTAETKTAL